MSREAELKSHLDCVQHPAVMGWGPDLTGNENVSREFTSLLSDYGCNETSPLGPIPLLSAMMDCTIKPLAKLNLQKIQH